MAVADHGDVLMHTMHEYKVTFKKLGRGTYGDVYLGRRTTSGEPVAVKKIELKHHHERQDGLIIRELKTLGKINHPNVIKLYEVEGTDRSLYIVMEYCEQRDLKCYLRGKELSEEHMMRFIHQSAEAVYFMHTMRPNPIIHRDIKPANFLISTQDGQLQLKVAGFGLAMELGTSEESITSTEAGTPLYMAPEVFLDSNSRAHYGKKADTFSLGIFILSLLNYTKERGYVPITVGDEGVGFWMKRLKNNKIRAYPPTTFSSQDTSQVPSLKTVAHLMLQRDPAERIDMSYVCQNIVRINNELGYENATRVQHSTCVLTHDVPLVHELGRLACTRDYILGPVRGKAMVDVYSWSGARLYILNHDELGIASTADCWHFTPVCENRMLLLVNERNSAGLSLHAYRIDNAPSSCVIDVCAL